MNDPTDKGLDAARASLIDSIYEAVLRPEHYDIFMADWSAHVERAVGRLEELRITARPAARTVSDPVIEAHFQRAFSILERMGRGVEAGGTPGVTAEAEPVIVFDAALARIGLSDEGRRLFGPDPGAEAVAQALDADSIARFRAIQARLRSAHQAGSFTVLALEEAEGGGQRLLGARTRRDEASRLMLELRPLEIRWSPAASTILADSFHLTPRQIELVRDLIAGQTLNGMAAESGRSPHTLRTQIKTVFQKTRTNSQSDLIRMVVALILFSPDTAAPVAAAAPEAETTAVLDLPDGRRIPLRQIGPEDGQPVIFIHGMLDGLASLRYLAPFLARHRLRLIAPTRPNFGQASPDDRIAEAPEVFARDLAAILDRMEIARPLLLGHMGGALYAYAAAARLNGRALGIVNVSGAVPIRSVRQFRLMTPRQRAVALTARFAPALLPAILRIGIAQIDGRDATQFLHALYPPGSPDRACIADAQVAQAIIDGYRFSVAQGERGFQIDSWHVTRDWSDLVTQARGPLLLLHGAGDPVVHVETVRAFAAESGRAALRVFEQGGQLLHYALPELVLAEIAGFLAQIERGAAVK